MDQEMIEYVTNEIIKCITGMNVSNIIKANLMINLSKFLENYEENISILAEHDEKNMKK